MDTLNQFRAVYDGTKAEFIADTTAKTTADNNNLIVFIKGTDDGKDACIYAQGMFFADMASLIAALAFVKGVNVGGTNYNAAAGGGYVKFAAADPATVVYVEADGVKIGLSAAFVTKVNDTATQLATIKGDYLTSADKTALNNLITALSNKVGDLANLTTTEKSTIVGAINEVAGSVGTAVQEGKVTITETAGTGEFAKTYTFKQGGVTIGTINTIKDLVIQSGEVKDKNGVKTLVLTLNNGNTIDIAVSDLVDVYTAGANATQIQLAISSGNVITATIVAGSVTSTELASNAVTSAKVAAKAITKEKLADAVQTSLGKADAAAPQATTYTKTEVDAMFAWVEL